MKFRIQCEVCEKITNNGIIVQDKRLRNRLFCSTKCLKEKIKEQKQEYKKIEEGWKNSLIYKITNFIRKVV